MGLSSKMGENKTGLARGDRERAMVEGTEEFKNAHAGNASGIAAERIELAKQAKGGIGSMPPPASVKQVGKAAVGALAGGSPNLLIDKLGERLAFERMGVRLYDALLSKHAAYGGFDGGPSKGDLELFRSEELEHFRLLERAIEGLGGDPTVITPSANVVAVASQGIMAVLVDARTNLKQSLEAILVAELADRDSWDGLIALARSAGQKEMARSFEKALSEEENHLRKVRSWVTNGMGLEPQKPVAQPRA
jgi:ferritin-like metal-binding protein YciE